MPIHLNWSRGRNLGLALIFLAVVGFIQVIFIIIAQYAMDVGVQYYVILIPIGVTLALTYSVIIVFESRTSMDKYRELRPHMQKNVTVNSITAKPYWIYLRPILIVLVAFLVFFFATFGIAYTLVDKPTLFVLSENIGAIGVLFTATYIETAMSRKMR
jgi:hypothetical protein